MSYLVVLREHAGRGPVQHRRGLPAWGGSVRPGVVCALVLTAAAIGYSGAAYASGSVLYGRIDLGLRNMKDVKAGARSSDLHMDDSSRGRFGIKGEEDLGNGLKVFFQFENRFYGYSGEQDGEQLWKDKAWLGLEKEGVGSLRMGRMSSPINDRGANGRFEAFDGNTLAGMGGRGAAQVTKWDNTLALRSAYFGGFSASAAYSFREGQDQKDAYGVSMEYMNQGWTVAVSWQQDTSEAKGGTPADHWQTAALAAVYKTDAYRLYGIAAHSWDIGVTDKGRARTYTVGFGIPMGPGEARASYQASMQRHMNGVDRRKDGQRHRLGVGYAYPLSKQTSVNLSVLHDRYQDAAVGRHTGTGWEIALRKNF